MNLRRGCSILYSLLTAFLPATSLAQSINIDFGSGGTAPSASYAAAGLAGAWNEIAVYPSGERAPLVGLDGSPIAAEIYGIGGTALRIEDDPATSGDDAALVDDMLIGYNNPVDVCIWVEDLPNGQYVVLIYALTPSNASLLHRVRVDNATPGPTMIGGAWPGAHQEELTYERFLVNVTNGYIGLHSGLYGGGPFESGINAIQIIANATGIDSPPSMDDATPRIERIYPNPGRGAQTFDLYLAPNARREALEIVDVTGRLVWRQPLAALAAGAHSIVWDGRDTAGRAVSPAVYFVRLPGAGEGWGGQQKIVRIE
jgi:hypothetical protein